MGAAEDRAWSDAELGALERRMAREYDQAEREMRAKLEEALAGYASELEAREKALDDTEQAMLEHEAWLRRKAAEQTRMGAIADQCAMAAHEANVRAAEAVNNATPRVYAEMAARAAFEVDSAVGRDTMFALVDEDAVRYAMMGGEDGQLVHEVTNDPDPQRAAEGLQSLRRDVEAGADIRWNRQQFTSAITQGILQGESIPNIVKRTRSVFNSNQTAAYRAARTACTGAENAGRVSSYRRAEGIGIKLKQEWLATLDQRTRSSHRHMDGEKVAVGERFGNGCRFPGDPTGPGYEVWNCRCTLVAAVDGIDQDEADRWMRLPDGMTYDEWLEGKPKPVAELKDGGRWADRAGTMRVDGAARTASPARPSPRPAARPAPRPAAPKQPIRTGYTMRELSAMKRDELVPIAREVSRKNAARMGITEEEALERFDLLIDANPDSYLRKYINRNGR